MMSHFSFKGIESFNRKVIQELEEKPSMNTVTKIIGPKIIFQILEIL